MHYLKLIPLTFLSLCSLPLYADDAAIAEGITALLQNKQTEAEAFFLKTLQQPELKNTSLIYLSRIALSSGDEEAAAMRIEQALAIAPNTVEETLVAGDIYCTQAQKSSMLTALKLAKKCIAQYEAAVALDNKNPEALMTTMQFYFGAPSFAGGSTEKGNALLKRLEELSPEDAKSYQITQLDKDGNTDAALKLADELTQKHFASARNQYQVARFYRDKKLYDKALPLFESLKSFPVNLKTNWFIQDSLLQQGELLMIGNKDVPKAIQLIEDYKQKNTNNKDIHYFWSSWSLAKAYKQLGNMTKYNEWVTKIRSENYKNDKFFSKEFEKNSG